MLTIGKCTYSYVLRYNILMDKPRVICSYAELWIVTRVSGLALPTLKFALRKRHVIHFPVGRSYAIKLGDTLGDLRLSGGITMSITLVSLGPDQLSTKLYIHILYMPAKLFGSRFWNAYRYISFSMLRPYVPTYM